MKLCAKCKTLKDPTEFHIHRREADGLRRECKACRVIESKKYFLKHRVRLNKEKRDWEKNNPHHKSNRNRASSSYRDRNPLKATARWKLREALYRGDVKKNPCLICRNKNSEAHHEDYTKPLQVVWMCRSHHRAWHRLFKSEGM